NERVPVCPKFRRPFFGDVESPAVDTFGQFTMRLHPAFGRLENVSLGTGMHVLAVAGGGERGQRHVSPPTFVGEFISLGAWIVEAFDRIPIFVTRIFLVLANVFEGEEVAAGVIENAVDDDVHAAFMRATDKIEK